MRNHVVVCVSALVTLSLAGISCKTADTERPARAPDIFHAVLPAHPASAPEISTAELQAVLAEKRALVFDARPFMEFAVSHIPGAVNLAAKPGVSKARYVSGVA